MALEEFTGRTVVPGEPLTAASWNELIDAMGSVTDYLLSSEASAVRVQVANAGIDLAMVRVTAEPESGDQAFEAVDPIPPDSEHVFAGLRPGVYSLRASAPGFDPASAVVTVPTEEIVTLTLVPRGATMPSLFGRGLGEALAELRTLGIAVDRVLDVAGREVAPANPGEEYVDTPVLIQEPRPGTPVPPEGRAQLAVAAALRVEPTIEVPSLAGLTLSEAQRALEGTGLVLGTVEDRRESGE